MSYCKEGSKGKSKKLKHNYPEGSNKCSLCGHVTTHGANFERLQGKGAR